MPDRGRNRRPHAQQALSESYDRRAHALVTLPSEPAVRYATPESLPTEPDTAYHTRTIAADDAAPNAAPPGANAFARAIFEAEVFFHVELAAGTATDVEVWCESSIGGATTVWVLVERYPAVESMREYRCRVNYRQAFLRCVNSVGLAANNATLRATGA